MSTDTAIKTLQESYKRMGELISVQEIRLLQNGDIVDFGKLSTTDQSGITVRHFRIIQIQSITEEGGDFVIQCIANCVYDQRKKTYLAKDTPLTIRAPGRKLNITGDLRVFHDDKDHTGSFFTAKIGKMSVLPIDGTSAF